MNRQQLQEEYAKVSGIHPTTTYDLEQQNAINQQPRNGAGVRINEPRPDQRNQTVSGVSSTPFEYDGSGNTSRSPHANQSSERPVADRDAFIQSDNSQQQWQAKMSPAERARQLASEMDQDIDRRRRSTGSTGEKILKIGGQKEYKLQ